MFLLQLYGFVIPGGGSVIVGYGVAEDGGFLCFIFHGLPYISHPFYSVFGKVIFFLQGTF